MCKEGVKVVGCLFRCLLICRTFNLDFKVICRLTFISSEVCIMLKLGEFNCDNEEFNYGVKEMSLANKELKLDSKN